MRFNKASIDKITPKTLDESDKLYNAHISDLTFAAYDFMDDYYVINEPPHWDDYKEDPQYYDWKEASEDYKEDKKEFYAKHNPYHALLKTDIWKEACQILVALKIFTLKGLKCEYCKKDIIVHNGEFLAIIHHKDYNRDIFEDEYLMLVHPSCHGLIHKGEA